MIGFDEVLSKVEARAAERGVAGPRKISSAIFADVAGLRSGRTSRRDADVAYSAFVSRDRGAPAAHAASLAGEIADAEGDALRLRVLRRRCALALHPDRMRGADGPITLAELNARIDAALQAKRDRP